jgi:hypothetical protein
MPTLADVLRNYTPPTKSALADPIKEHFRTLPQQLAQNQAAMDNTMASMYKTDFMGKPNPNYRPEAIQEFTQLMPIAGIMAYHGTNTKFNKFKDALANTKDEGWLGKGHYFSTDPNVARANKYVANVDLEANKPYELAMPDFSTDKRELIRSALNLEKTATAKDVTNKLKELGHDSVVLDYSPTGYKNKEILVFGGKQANIKNWADVPKTSFNKTLLENEIKALQNAGE